MNTEFSFSICMPVYQGSHLIGNSIDSFHKHSFGNYVAQINNAKLTPLNIIVSNTRLTRNTP
jgi:hypothetical protein